MALTLSTLLQVVSCQPYIEICGSSSLQFLAIQLSHWLQNRHGEWRLDYDQYHLKLFVFFFLVRDLSFSRPLLSPHGPLNIYVVDRRHKSFYPLPTIIWPVFVHVHLFFFLSPCDIVFVSLFLLLKRRRKKHGYYIYDLSSMLYYICINTPDSWTMCCHACMSYGLKTIY